MQSKNRIILNRSYRVLIFSVFLLVNTGINTSGGLIASASTAIKTQLQMNNKQFGLFGTIFGVGRVSGSLLFMLLINKFNRKYIMGIVFLCKSFILMSFKTTNVPWMLVGLRGINGICHMFPVIYTPVWIDQFGIQKYRMIFMTILQVFIPAGKVLGYFLNMILGEENWQNGFLFEGIFFLFASMFVFCTPDKFFSSQITVVKDSDKTEHVEIKQQRVVSIFQIQQVSTNDSSSSSKKQTYFNELTYILRNNLFLIGALVRSILLGVNTAFHYWISDYMRNGLNINDSRVIFISYTLMNIGGPIGGVLVGSIVNFFFGGYENRHSGTVLLVTHIISCVFGMLIPFMITLYSFCGMTLMYLIFNSSALPMIQGIIITSVNAELKGTAFSIANLFTMALTSGPAPFFYGAVNDLYHDTPYKNRGMIAIMLCCCFGILLMMIMAVIRYRRYNELEGQGKKVSLFERDPSKDDISGSELQTKETFGQRLSKIVTEKISETNSAYDYAGINDESRDDNSNYDDMNVELGYQ